MVSAYGMVVSVSGSCVCFGACFCYNRIVSSQAVDITSKRNIVPSYKAFLAVRIDFIKAMSELTSPCIKYLFFRWQVAS